MSGNYPKEYFGCSVWELQYCIYVIYVFFLFTEKDNELAPKILVLNTNDFREGPHINRFEAGRDSGQPKYFCHIRAAHVCLKRRFTHAQ